MENEETDGEGLCLASCGLDLLLHQWWDVNGGLETILSHSSSCATNYYALAYATTANGVCLHYLRPHLLND